MSDHPEHDKMSAIVAISNSIGGFLDWLDDNEITLCQVDIEDGYYPIHMSKEKLLAKFFGIDLDKIEKEKQQMLKELRGES